MLMYKVGDEIVDKRNDREIEIKRIADGLYFCGVQDEARHIYYCTWFTEDELDYISGKRKKNKR